MKSLRRLARTTVDYTFVAATAGAFVAGMASADPPYRVPDPQGPVVHIAWSVDEPVGKID